MKTMGLTRLTLVAPREFPSTEAVTLASGAADVLEQATLCASLQEALADVSVAAALTSRRREIATPLLTPRQACPSLLARRRRRAGGAGVWQRNLWPCRLRKSSCAMCW